jgi:DNA-binding MarR family transcriptional regulator
VTGAHPAVDVRDPLRPAGLLGHVVRLNLAVNRVLDDITSAHGISVADYLVLGVVRWSPDHRSAPTAICEVLDRTTGGMSLTLDRMEDAGWLRRRADPTDGRRVVVEATKAGVALATRVNDALHQWEASLELSAPERREITDALEHLSTAIG